MVSLNLQPTYADIESIFVNVEADTLNIENYLYYQGHRYDDNWYWVNQPGDTILPFSWNMNQGYKVWTKDDTIFLPELSVSDTNWYCINAAINITPNNRNIFYIAYTPCWDMPCSTAFYQLTHWPSGGGTINVLLWACQYNTGKTYFPDQNAVIYSMRQGEGYYIKLAGHGPYNDFQFTTLIEPPLESLPGNGDIKNSVNNGNQIKSISTNHFNYRMRTQDIYPIILDNIQIEGVIPQIGDEIGVFMWDTVCVGAEEYSGDSILIITTWADEINTPDSVDGFIIEEVMSFRYWDESESQELDLTLLPTINSAPQSEDAIYSTIPIFGRNSYGKYSFAVTPIVEIPTQFLLHQNYPNPFNPATKIKFDLPEPSNVKLEIFNVLGQRVITLKDQTYSAGYKEVIWDSKSSSGVEISSGLYFYRIEVKELTTEKRYSQTKKMMLLK